jgi:hypothetical protein
MFPVKLKIAARVLLVVLLAAGTSLVGYKTLTANPQAELIPKPAEDRSAAPANGPDRLKNLLKERFELAEKEYKIRFAKFRDMEFPELERCCYSSLRVLEAQKDLSDKKADVVAAWEAHLARVKELARIAANFARTGQGMESDASMARFYYLDAEIGLERAKAK